MQIKQKVVITGHCGFIGAHLYNLCSAFAEVVGVDIKGATPIDITDYDALLEACQGADVIFHLAALSSESMCQINPALAQLTNVEGTRNVFEVAKVVGARVIFTSSAAVYGNIEGACAEWQVPYPNSIYGKTKLDGECIAQQYLSQGVVSCCARLFNVYGPDLYSLSHKYARSPKGVINIFVQKALHGQGHFLVIDSDGNQTRDFIHVLDVIDTLLALYHRTYSPQWPTIVNVGTGQSTSVYALARAVMGLAKQKTLNICYTGSHNLDMIKHSLADTTQLRLVYKPIPRNILTGLEGMLC